MQRIIGSLGVVVLCVPVALGLRSATDPVGARPAQQSPLEVFDHAAQLLRERHPAPFRLLGRELFEQRLAELRSQLTPESSDSALAVAILSAVHLLAEGHSHLALGDGAPADMVYPLRFVADGPDLRIEALQGLDERALGGRVVKIGDVSWSTALERLFRIATGDNEHFARVNSIPRLLRYPRLAIELGLAEEDGSITFMVESLSGDQIELFMNGPAEPGAVWTDLDLGIGPAAIPFLRNPHDPFWVLTLPEHNAVYAQYNQVDNRGDATTETFAADIVRALESSGADKLIVDVRRNGGGNNFRNPPILHAILKNETINQPGHLFVLTSPRTYSACVNFCGWLEQETNAIFIGEPTGAPPNMYGDVERFALDRDGWELAVSAWHWQESMPWDERIFIQPYVTARASIPDLLAGRDPVLDAALGFDDPELVEVLTQTQKRNHFGLANQQPAIDARANWPRR